MCSSAFFLKSSTRKNTFLIYKSLLFFFLFCVWEWSLFLKWDLNKEIWIISFHRSFIHFEFRLSIELLNFCMKKRLFYGVYLVVVASGGSFCIRSSFKNKYSNMLWADKTRIMGWIGSNHFVCVLLNALLIRVDLSLIRLFGLWLNPFVSVTTRIITCTGFLELILTSIWWLTVISMFVCFYCNPHSTWIQWRISQHLVWWWLQFQICFNQRLPVGSELHITCLYYFNWWCNCGEVLYLAHNYSAGTNKYIIAQG